MLTNPWIKFLRQFIGWFVVLTFAGLIIGQLSWVYLAGTIGLIIWHGLNIHRLESWLRNEKSIHPPDSYGLWEEIFLHVYHLQRRNRDRQKRLAEFLRRFRESAEAMPDGVIDLTRSGDINWWNGKAADMLGLQRQKDQGQFILNLLRNPRFVKFFKQYQPESVLEMRSPIDETRMFEFRLVPYGKKEYLLLIRDISERDRITQMRRDFVANISHELRTPLTVVRGCIETINDDEVPEHQQRPLQMMHEQALRMESLLDELLALSKLQASGQAPTDEAVSLADLVHQIIDEAKLPEKYSNHTFKVQLDNSLLVRGVRSELHSTVQNLIHNAIHYTPDQGEIVVEWKAEGDGAMFSVGDTGIGIPQALIPRLTERFFRTSLARETRGKGTGLGLAIVKHVLSRHEAQLEIDSIPGKGSEFSCHFSAERVTRLDADDQAVINL